MREASNVGRLDERASEVYISPKDLMVRWSCSRATADRIARRAGLTRVFLGEGKHGIVRFLLSEVREWEESRKVRDAY